jgi:hypothetical protein
VEKEGNSKRKIDSTESEEDDLVAVRVGETDNKIKKIKTFNEEGKVDNSVVKYSELDIRKYIEVTFFFLFIIYFFTY